MHDLYYIHRYVAIYGRQHTCFSKVYTALVNIDNLTIVCWNRWYTHKKIECNGAKFGADVCLICVRVCVWEKRVALLY